jgi:hypothetical protein
MSVTEYAGRTFDFVARHDPGNVPFRLAAPRGAEDLFAQAVFHTPGTLVLDQGSEGACVPHGVEGEAMASPERWKPQDPQALAFVGYDWCRRNDPFPGENYDGTDVNTGMKWARMMGWITHWNWSFNALEFRTGLQKRPAVIGIDWTTGAYDAYGGILDFQGPVVGGHCILVTGYTPRHRKLGQAYRLRNSWGPSWGLNGSAYVAREQLESLIFERRGEAAFANL